MIVWVSVVCVRLIALEDSRVRVEVGGASL